MQSPFSVVGAQISIGNPCSHNTVSPMVLIQVFNCASQIFAPSGLGITQGNTSRILSLFLFQPVQCGETFALSHTLQLSPCRCSPCHAQELGAASPCESFSESVPQQQCLFLRGAHLPAESKGTHLNQVSPSQSCVSSLKVPPNFGKFHDLKWRKSPYQGVNMRVEKRPPNGDSLCLSFFN